MLFQSIISQTLIPLLVCITVPNTHQSDKAPPNQAPGVGSNVSGGDGNDARGLLSTIGGGEKNSTLGLRSTIGGGMANTATGNASTIGGGVENTTSGNTSSIDGGMKNEVSGDFGTIGGGLANRANALGSTVGGGEGNTAAGEASTVPGGRKNWAGGKSSFAAGTNANDLGNDHSFVWGGAEGKRSSAGEDTFNVWSAGGIYLNGAVHASSDRNMKEDFSTINAQEVLAKVLEIPVTTWRFKSEDHSVRHIGPVAQDFMAAFGYGVDNRHITSTDADGVALAAIQGLNEKLKLELDEKQAEIDFLNERLVSFEQRLSAIENTYK
ncbi:MAG: tail fiber domain-containing protein [Candidatus Hydrogenedentota bacterium]